LATLAALVLVAGPAAGGSAQATQAACVAGPHQGTITTDETWCTADNPHQMTGNVTVATGVVLTLEPGITVMADIDAPLLVEGQLEATGCEEQPIVFTSQSDSGPGQWPGITFDGGTGTLRHAIVRYADGRIYTCPSGINSAAISAVNVQSGEVAIEDSQIISSAHYANDDAGLCVVGSRVVVSDTLFSGIGDNPAQPECAIYADVTPQPVPWRQSARGSRHRSGHW